MVSHVFIEGMRRLALKPRSKAEIHRPIGLRELLSLLYEHPADSLAPMLGEHAESVDFGVSARMADRKANDRRD